MVDSGLRIVSVGGGTGLSTLLRGLKQFVHSDGRWSIEHLSAIVTVTDEGGSSGVLRKELSMLPPGDVRNCIVALAEEELLLSKVFRYRFGADTPLRGHSLGNLLLAALTDLTGSFESAILAASEVLAIRGEIYPSTLADVRLRAICADGSVLIGETAISGDHFVGAPVPEHPPIRRLEIEPAEVQPVGRALEAIAQADMIVIGPGSLYTSILPNLVIPALGEAIRRARALRVYICNVMTQPGETSGYAAEDHLRAIVEHAGLVADVVLINGRRPSESILRTYEAQNQHPVRHDSDAIRELGANPFFADVVAEGDFVRHDPEALAQTLFRLFDRYGRRLQRIRRGEA
ncbi:MAG TPA: uridine diphosphate-N-acetylglucosamine-binding protein YvcK [Thermoanaerobaculia bacterium]|nr:uridine diphosphate-N-acetylglucosamine-binding protein YvcK [Thermoanaerobaculia bacterium]